MVPGVIYWEGFWGSSKLRRASWDIFCRGPRTGSGGTFSKYSHPRWNLDSPLYRWGSCAQSLKATRVPLGLITPLCKGFWADGASGAQILGRFLSEWPLRGFPSAMVEGREAVGWAAPWSSAPAWSLASGWIPGVKEPLREFLLVTISHCSSWRSDLSHQLVGAFPTFKSSKRILYNWVI